MDPRVKDNDVTASTRSKQKGVKASGTAAKAAAGDAYVEVRDRASAAYKSAKSKASDAYGTAKSRAAASGRKASETISDNPVPAVIGGLAIGALLGALLPRTESEANLLGPVGDKLKETGKRVTGAARDAGRDHLQELGLLGDGAQDKLSNVVEMVITAVNAVSGAARGATRGS